MKFKFLLIALVAGIGANAQSLLEPIPKPVNRYSIDLTDTLTPGSNYTGLRLTGPTMLYAFAPNNIKNTSTVYTMVGIDYESDAWDPNSNKFFTNWAVGLQVGEGGQFAPTSVSAVTAAALTFSFQKIGNFESPFKITIGVVYSFTNKNIQPALGPGVVLNN